MKKRSLLALLLILLLTFALAACGGSGDSEEPAAEEETTAEETTEEEAPAPAAPEDVVVDAEAGTVTITAQLNGAFFDQSTMHYCVWKDGGAGDKAMLAAYCTAEDFYNGMLEAGGTPGTKTKDEIEGGAAVDGQSVDVTLTWEGQDTPVSMSDSVKTSDGKPDIDMRFCDNLQGNKDCGSGCIACLNSCWAGITSNAAYEFGAVDSGNPSIYLDDSVMPGDGTDVQITFTLK